MAKTVFSKTEIIKLRNSLPLGWQDTLASKFELSRGRVQNIMSGNGTNDDVVLEAIELAKSHQATLNEAKEAINNL